MSDQGRGDAASQLVKELRGDLRDAMGKIDRVSSRMEDLAVAIENIQLLREEQKMLRQAIHGKAGVTERLSRLEQRLEDGVIRQDDKGGIYISPGYLTLGIAVVGFVLTGLWQFIDWLIQLAGKIGR